MSETETTEAPAPAAEKPAATPHLYLVDGSSYIFRAYHRLPPLTNKHGQPAGAVYGYTTMLWKLAGDLTRDGGPTHMAVILDASEHTHRNEMYDQYKAHRPPPPEDLVPQFPLIRVATRISGNCGTRSSGGGGRCALYWSYISLRWVCSDASRMTAMCVGPSARESSPASFHSMVV